MEELRHYGVSKLDGAPGRGSGRYPLGSGKNPKTVFVSGSSKTQDQTSEYYRKDLPKEINLAIVLDEGAKATRNNVDRLISQNKNVKVYQLNKSGNDEWLEETLTSGTADKANNIYNSLSKTEKNTGHCKR